MSEILIVLCFVGFFVGVITVIGHGIWLLGAWILGRFGIVGESVDPGLACYRCGHAGGIKQGICRHCGYRTVARQRQDVETAIGLLERLHAAKQIRDSDFQGVMPALQSAAAKLRMAAGLDPERPSRGLPATASMPPVAGRDQVSGPAAAQQHRVPVAPAPSPPMPEPSPVTMDDQILEAELVMDAASSGASPFAHAPHPLDAPEPEPAAVAAAAATAFSPRRTMADMLQSFMEEKNIRWGELASGILIVGSAIGLVISLRAKLAEISQQIPYFPALLFMLGTVAIHAAGLYTLRRWKLRATSRGVLIIATLLVPLSFAAGIVLSGSGDTRTPVTSPFYIAAVLAGVIGYGAVTTFSARALFPEGWWRLTVVVIGTSVGQLLINRLADVKTSWPLVTATALFALPLVSYLAATLSQLRAVAIKTRLTPARAAQTYTVLGVAVFALAVPLTLQAWVSGDVRKMFTLLSPSLSIAATVVLSLGVAIQRRCDARRMAETRTVGTALAILGAMIMLGTLVTAWPSPPVLIAVGTVTAITLISLAIVGQLPILHAGATAAASFAILLLFHHLNGQFTLDEAPRGHDVVRALLMGRSAAVLLVLAFVAGAIGVTLQIRKQLAEGLVYLAAMVGVATASLAIALHAGFWSHVDGDWTTLVFAFYAASVLAASPRIKSQWATAVGSALALVTLIHLCQFNGWFSGRLADADMSLARPVLFSFIAHGLLTVLYGLGLAIWLGRRDAQRAKLDGEALASQVIRPLAIMGAFTAALTVPFVLTVQSNAFGAHALYAAGIAITWAVAAGLDRNAHLATASHAAATVALAFVTAAYALRQAWSDYPLADFRHWQCQFAVLSLWCAISSALRLVCRRWPRTDQLLQPPWPTVDQLLLGAVMLGLVYLGVAGCGAGVLVELGFLSTTHPLAVDTWHTVAYQTGSWIALACAAAALGLLLFERFTLTRLSGLVIATAIIPLLLAGRWEDSLSVASALRWFFAIHVLAWTALLSVRKPLQQWASGTFPAADLGERAVDSIRNISMFIGIVPVAALTSLAAGQMLQGAPLQGPLPDSFFGQLTANALYGVPLALLVVATLVSAVRDGSAVYALLGSLLLQYGIALAVLIPTFSQWQVGTRHVYVLLTQWTACGLGGYALAWLASDRWINRAKTRVGQSFLDLQLLAAGAATAVLAIWSLLEIFAAPDRAGSEVAYLGWWPSYLAALFCTLGLLVHFRHAPGRLALLSVFAPCVLATLAAATSHTLDQNGAWLGYHVLTGCFLAVALIAQGIACWRTIAAGGDTWITPLGRAATFVACLTFVLVGRGCVKDPLAPWWTIGMASGLFLFFAAQAIRLRKQVYAYGSIIVAVFAASVTWSHLTTVPADQVVIGFLYANVITASLAGLFYLAVEIWFQGALNQSLDEQASGPRVHAAAAMVGLVVMLLVSVGGSALSAIDGLAGPSAGWVVMNWWGAGAVLALGLLLFAMLWDRQIGASLIATYLWGFVLIALILNLVEQVGPWGGTGTIVGACLLGAAYLALVGHLWKWGANLARAATRLGIPEPIARLEDASRWLPGFNVLGSLVISSLGFVTVFAADERAMRMSVAFAPLMLAYGVSCLAQPRRRFAMQCLALGLVVVSAVFIGWADVARSLGDSATLAYAARLLIVLAGMTLAYSLLLTRWVGTASDWFEPVRRMSAILAVATGITLAFVLLLEVVTFRPGEGAPIAMPEVIAISVMLLGFIIALLCMAVLPGRDPLALSDKGREGYVYAAQIIAAVLGAHIYLAEPQLFNFGIFKDYWPYIVMAIAFVSVAIGEFCHRHKWTVIAQPMERTGGFLPILPALTAMAFSQTNYPLVLFFGGLLYVFLSITRRSLIAGIAAAVMGNGALWALLNDTGLVLADQPQFWMIPPALSVLVAAYVNRDRLSDSSLTAIRYICVMIIYLSSTGEMFMRLLVPEGSDDWLRPIILASLSVAGIFAGILLRVRAFLYLGASFLLLSIVTMVWNAGRVLQHTWPWWVFGISLGLVILVVFGLFEKHRREIQQLVSRLRQWEP